jgi:hypothetical protein
VPRCGARRSAARRRAVRVERLALAYLDDAREGARRLALTRELGRRTLAGLLVHGALLSVVAVYLRWAVATAVAIYR